MLRRFCLYGFLKNQQYYEPFLWLALLAKGLSLTEVGLLMGFRAICVNVLEVPTGEERAVHGATSMFQYESQASRFSGGVLPGMWRGSKSRNPAGKLQ